MLPLALVLAFLVLPVVEIYTIIQVGEVIGAWPTVALLVFESLLGGWIMRREGRRAWRALQETFERGVVPDRELADAGLVLVGGALLLTPGFVTDVFGFAFVLPFTRPLVRGLVSRWAARRMRVAQARSATLFPPPGGGFGAGPFGQAGPGGLGGFGPFGAPARDAGTPSGPVVRGEVIDLDEDTGRDAGGDGGAGAGRGADRKPLA
ncbi:MULTISPECIES: FxsA family protein [Actinomadura]|uniref:FxsA family protein n=1 Tax=Actinomadura TaxID=1988 RepID=UPI000415ED36|nr:MULTISPECIES: FxsA family protein [Actinomadura]